MIRRCACRASALALTLAAAALLVAACASDGSSSSNRLPEGGNAKGDGGRDSAADAGDVLSRATDAGDSGDASEHDNDPTDPAPTCAPVIALGNASVLPFSTQDDDVGLSVTLDGLTAAWSTTSGLVVTIHSVDRASTAATFDTARTLTGPFSPGRVALTPDGLGLAVVNEDGLGFSLLRRVARGDAFGAPTEGAFSQLNAQGAETLGPAGERYADPLFARNGGYFFFSRFTAESTRTVHLASRILLGDAYSTGGLFAEATFTSTPGGRNIVTGASDDVRTLFVWNQSTNKSRTVRLNASGFVVSSAELGPMRDVQTSSDCRTFYFSQGSPADMFRATLP